jgi:hypothetical protein
MIDIFVQLIFQIPIEKDTGIQEWMKRVGIARGWRFVPDTLYLGQDTTVEDIISPNIAGLMFRGVLYCLIAIQLDILNSRQYLKFYDTILFQNREQA